MAVTLISHVKKVDRLVWLGWVLASTFGVVVGFVSIYGAVFLAKAVAPGVNEDRLAGWIMFPLVIVALSACQAIVLRSLIRIFWRWPAASLAGAAVAAVAGDACLRAITAMTGHGPEPGLAAPLILMLVGACLGLAQWLVLRRHMRRSAWWIPASIGGWLSYSLVIGGTVTSLLEIAAVGVLPSLFTGFVLARNLDRRRAGHA
jgi:hypothetical protein